MRLKVVSDYKFREKDAFLLLLKKKISFHNENLFSIYIWKNHPLYQKNVHLYVAVSSRSMGAYYWFMRIKLP